MTAQCLQLGDGQVFWTCAEFSQLSNTYHYGYSKGTLKTLGFFKKKQQNSRNAMTPSFS